MLPGKGRGPGGVGVLQVLGPAAPVLLLKVVADGLKQGKILQVRPFFSHKAGKLPAPGGAGRLRQAVGLDKGGEQHIEKFSFDAANFRVVHQGGLPEAVQVGLECRVGQKGLGLGGVLHLRDGHEVHGQVIVEQPAGGGVGAAAGVGAFLGGVQGIDPHEGRAEIPGHGDGLLKIGEITDAPVAAAL